MDCMFEFVQYSIKILLSPPYFINIRLDIVVFAKMSSTVRMYLFYTCQVTPIQNMESPAQNQHENIFC